MTDLTETDLEDLYQWIDTVPLSRRKKNLPRDFSDAVLMSEVVHHFFPRLVDLHNYDQALRIDTRVANWTTLSSKVLKRLNLELDTETIAGLASARVGMIEGLLWNLRQIVIGKERQKEKPYFEEIELPDPVQWNAERLESDKKLLRDKIEECNEQAEYIQALESKIFKLEELMKLKDAKIAKLTNQGKPHPH
jgi:hypothetical protein